MGAERPPFPQVPSMAPAPGPAPGPVQGPAEGPGSSPGSGGGGGSSSGSYDGSGSAGGSLSSSAGGGSTPSEPDFTVYPEAPVTAPTGLQVTGPHATCFSWVLSSFLAQSTACPFDRAPVPGTGTSQDQVYACL